MKQFRVRRYLWATLKRESALGPGITFDSAEKPLRSSFESLRTNGGWVEIIGEFPLMLSVVEAFMGVFSRITF
jgi:hypothetical protein